MKKTKLVLAFMLFVLMGVGSYAQSSIFTGDKDKRMEKLNNTQNSSLDLKVKVETGADIIGKIEGSHRGFKFVPILPFFPRRSAGVFHSEASEIIAEKRALKDSGGDIILDKKVERTFTGFLLVFWIEKVTVTGFAAKLKK